jgi:hypothetical protein
MITQWYPSFCAPPCRDPKNHHSEEIEGEKLRLHENVLYIRIHLSDRWVTIESLCLTLNPSVFTRTLLTQARAPSPALPTTFSNPTTSSEKLIASLKECGLYREKSLKAHQEKTELTAATSRAVKNRLSVEALPLEQLLPSIPRELIPLMKAYYGSTLQIAQSALWHRRFSQVLLGQSYQPFARGDFVLEAAFSSDLL